jgi:hypothetical protein
MTMSEKYKVLDLEFEFTEAVEDDGMRIFLALERDLPERLWRDCLVSCGWNIRTRQFRFSIFEEALEDRACVVRCLADMGITPTETVRYI